MQGNAADRTAGPNLLVQMEACDLLTFRVADWTKYLLAIVSGGCMAFRIATVATVEERYQAV